MSYFQSWYHQPIPYLFISLKEDDTSTLVSCSEVITRMIELDR